MPSYSLVLTDVFALSLLMLLLVNFLQGERGSSAGHKLFSILFACNVAALAADLSQFLLDGASGFMESVRTVCLSVLFAMPVCVCLLWDLFVFLQIHPNLHGDLHRTLPRLLPGIAVAGVALFSRLNGYFFVFGPQNTPHRGSFFWLYAVVCLCHLLSAQTCLLKSRKLLSRRFSASIALCALPPLIGAAIQPLFPGPSPLWPGLTFSLLVLYLNFQRGRLATDHLTGLYNRGRLDIYLREWAGMKHPPMLGGIMADLDAFKLINDRYGHVAGDRALVDAGNILRTSVRADDFVCRYGGDEFILIVRVRSRAELERVVARIQSGLERYNCEGRMPFLMNLSLGYDIYDPQGGVSIRQFLRHIDQLMYRNKHARKQQQKRVIQVPVAQDGERQAPP